MDSENSVVLSHEKSYEDKVYFIGRISAILFWLVTLLLPVTLYFAFGLAPDKTILIKALTVIYAILIPVMLGEFLSFAPVMGAAAYFVMLLSGNFMNIKVPATMVALEAAGIDPKSEEGDYVSTMAVAASAITSEIVILIGVIMLAPFTSFFTQPAIKAGFGQILPALFGAMWIAAAIKNWKYVLVPTLVGFAIVLNSSFYQKIALYYIPVMAVISILITLVLFKFGFYTPKNKQ